MNKKLFLALTAIFFFCSSKGEAADKAIDWGMKISIKAELPGKWKGENIDITMFRPGIGTSIGGVARFYLPKNFYFEPGIALFYSGYKYKDLILMGSGDKVEEKDPKVTKWGLQIPILAGYHITITEQFGLEVFTGPQLRYAFAGKINIKNKSIKEEVESSFDLWGINGQRRLDCSWKVGIGFPVNNSVLSLEADFGITDLLKGNQSFRENRVGIGFTKFF